MLIIRAEEVASCADQIKLTLRGVKLANKDGMFGKSDPFFTILRLREDEQWQQAGIWGDTVFLGLLRVGGVAVSWCTYVPPVCC